MSLSAGFPIGPAELDLKSTTSFTWTNKTSNSLTNTNTQSSTATVACPSLNWTGADFVTVYYDTLYGTFLFALDDGTGRARLLTGTITDVDGDLVPHEPLKLVIGNKTYQTFSRNDGSFRFLLPAGQPSPGATTGTLIVGSANAISKSVSVGPLATATAALPTPPPSLSVALGTAPVTPTPVPLPSPNSPSARMATPVVPPPPPPVYITVTNRGPFATAKNVTVTSIQATAHAGGPLAYSGNLPFTVPAGTALKAGHAANFPLTFNYATGPTSRLAAPRNNDRVNQPDSVSFLAVTVKADNLAPFSTVLIQPAGSPALE
jgi:hypothetical protein